MFEFEPHAQLSASNSKSSTRSLPALAVLCLAALFWSIAAQAHARLVAAVPAPNTRAAAPKVIQLQFSTELAKKFSTLKVTDTKGNVVAANVIGSKDPRVLQAIPTTLAPGIYTVSWTAVSTEDGHKTSGRYSFTVR